MLITDYMNPNFISLGKEDTLEKVVDTFLNVNFKIIPIVDENNLLIGIISKRNVFKLLATQASLDLQVSEFYRENPVYLEDSITLYDAKDYLLKHNIGHAPIVNSRMEPIGIISTEELLNSYNITYDQLTSVINFAYDAIIVINNKGQITMVNKSFYDLFSLNNDVVLSKSISDLLPELDFNKIMELGINITNSPQIINGKQSLVSVSLIKEDNKINSAICKIAFRSLTNLQEALTAVEKLKKQVSNYKSEIRRSKGTRYTLYDIAGDSAAIQKVKNEAMLASKSSSTVLITGETGTGKELVAQGIHAASYQTGRFVVINCAAIPAELLESELFGYTDGAFTGARPGGMKGKFELAQNGTIFLDEIGDMPMPLQVKLLRVLQEKTFSPLGSSKIIHLDTKIIAATNKDLLKGIYDGSFREDLYYRLNVMHIKVSPLRERIEDIPEITDIIIGNLNQSGFYIKGITHKALMKLMNYSWPGNVRELHNTLERAANLQTGDYIDEVHISLLHDVQTGTFEHEGLNHNFQQRINLTEKDTIINALKEAGGNKTKASKLLGISRTWLYKKIKEHGIN